MTSRHDLRAQSGRIFDFIRFLSPEDGGRSFRVLLVLLVAGLSEGISILLLVPILAGLQPGSTQLTLDVPPIALVSFQGAVLSASLASVLTALVGVVAAQALLMRLSSLLMVDAVLTMTDRVRLTLFGSIGLARYRYLVRARHSDLNHAVTTDVERVQAVLNNLFLLAQSLLLLAIYTVAAVIISPAMTAFATAFGLAFLVILHPIRRFASEYGERITEQRQAQYRTVAEFLGGLKLVKSLNAEPRYLRDFQKNMITVSSDIRRFFRISAVPGLLFQVMSAAAAAAFVFVAIRYLAMPLERIAVLLILLMRISPRFTSIQGNIQQILLNIGGFTAIKTLIVACREEQEILAPSQLPAPELCNQVAFENVSFRYTSDGPLVLKGIDLIVPAGKITAIIGPSGGGKSTVADLLMGLLEPSQGRIRIDGVALATSNRRRWRSKVAYVPQDVFLAHDTIAMNLRLAAPKADEAALWRALSKAQAAEFVRRLPLGLHTVVGERGAQLSGGERQRIALARALLSAPQLLILDEATSALDWENQALIARAIEQLKGQMTIVTIAHRPSMIAFADWVIALEEGVVEETGAFSTVIQSPQSHLSRLMEGERVRQTERPATSHA